MGLVAARGAFMRHRGFLIILAATALRPAFAADEAQASIERGRLELERAQLEDAQASYLEGIGQLTAELGSDSPALIEPYSELARIYMLNSQPLEAIAVLETARDVSHRNYGLFNLEQVPLLDEIGNAYLMLGNTVEAQNLQRERLNVALRRFGEDDPRTIPYRNYLATYYDQSRMRMLAREEYEAVMDIQREAFGENDGRLLIPLSQLLAIDIRLGNARSARGQLMRTLESSTNATPLQRANALAVLGDWEQARFRTEAAQDYYREAYDALHEDQPSLAEEFFASPRYVDFAPPASRVDWQSNPNSYAWGFIEAQFDISAEGKAANIVISRSSPPMLMDALYARRLAEAVFRPRLANGEPTPTPGVSYRHDFRYRISE